MEPYFQFLVVLILTNIIGLNGASIDIELKINVDRLRGYDIHGRSKRQNDRMTPKKHFLQIYPEDRMAQPSPLKSTLNLVTRSAVEGQDPNYPYEEIKRYLEANPHLMKYFSSPVPNLANRGGGEEDEGEDICNSRTEQFYSPQKLANIRGEMKTIINDPDHLQFVERVTCNSDFSSTCTDYKKLGYTGTCVQKYIRRKLLIFDRNASSFDDFPIPSCCACKLKIDNS